MELKTNLYKGREGWTAETSVELDAPYSLEIRTFKSNRGLVTTANRMKNENGGQSFIMFSDFTKTVSLTQDRCTEKTVKAQHAAALAKINSIKAECAAFYVAKALKDAA